MTIKVTKLPNGKYKVEETLTAPKTTEIVDKVGLDKAIRILEQDMLELQVRLDYKRNILTKINEVK